MNLKKFLKRASETRLEKPLPDPWDDVDNRARILLAEYDRQTEGGEADSELWVRILQTWAEEHRSIGFYEGIAASDKLTKTKECSCRCRVHGRKACVRCLVTERCEEHGDPSPEEIYSEDLRGRPWLGEERSRRVRHLVEQAIRILARE